jgi:hypothetical protein
LKETIMSVRELNIIAVYTDAKHKEVWKRRYMTIDSALARATLELGSKGKPKDTVTFTLPTLQCLQYATYYTLSSSMATCPRWQSG